MTDEQKEEMKEELKTVYKYDMFIDENPDVQERVERGITQEAISKLQWSVTTLIQQRFPTLLAQVQPQIEQIQDTKKLEKLFVGLISATTEDEIRKLLNIKKASRRRKQ